MIVGYDASPEQVVVMLKSRRRRAVLMSGGPLPDHPHVVFMTFELFERHNIDCRKSSNVYHVCADPFALSRYQIPVSDLRDPLPPISATRVVPNLSLTRVLIKKTKAAGSLFAPLMTHIYKLPSKTEQRPATELCCRYLNSEFDWPEFESRIRKLVSKPRLADRLLELMQAPVSARLISALSSVRSGSSREDAAAANRVQIFEVSYVIGNLSKRANCTDLYVQNQGT